MNEAGLINIIKKYIGEAECPDYKRIENHAIELIKDLGTDVELVSISIPVTMHRDMDIKCKVDGDELTLTIPTKEFASGMK